MNTHDELFKIIVDNYSTFKEVDYIYYNIKNKNNNNNDILFLIFINCDKYEHELQSNMIEKEINIEDMFDDMYLDFHYIPIKFVNKHHCIDYDSHILYKRSKQI